MFRSFDFPFTLETDMTNDELTTAIHEFDGGDDFLKGYILGVGFTSQNTEGENWFGAGSGEFSDYVSVEEIVEAIGYESMHQLLTEVLAFLKSAHHLLIDCDMEDAGSNFHYTRNGHGCGFWDGDWPEHGDKLTELSKPFGEFEFYDGYMG
jgi:hypothetical protein